MINPIDKILTEWAYRVHDGMPDPKDSYHLIKLDEVLSEIDAPPGFKIRMMNRMRGLTEVACGPGQNPKRDGCIAADAQKVSDRGVSDDDIKSFDDDELASIKHDALSTPEPTESRMEVSADHIEDHKSDTQKENDRRHDEAVEKKKAENIKLTDKERADKANKVIDPRSKDSGEEKSRNLASLTDGTTETAMNLIDANNNNIRNGNDLPEGTPASTFAEQAGTTEAVDIHKNMDNKRAQIAKDTGRPAHEITDEEVIGALAEDMANSDPPDPAILKKIKKKDRLGWCKVALTTAAAQKKSLEDNAEEYDCDIPVEILGGGVSDGKTKAVARSHCNDRIKAAEERQKKHKKGSPEWEHAQKEIDHYEFTKKWLDNPDTDSFVFYKTKDGFMGVKHISNKKGFKDPALNTTVGRRGKLTKEKSKIVAKDRGMTDKEAEEMADNIQKTTNDALDVVRNADAGMKDDTRESSKRVNKSKDNEIDELEKKEDKTEEEQKKLDKLKARKQQAQQRVDNAKKELGPKEKEKAEMDGLIKENRDEIDKKFDPHGIKEGSEIDRVPGKYYFWNEKKSDWYLLTGVAVEEKLGKKSSIGKILLQANNTQDDINVLTAVKDHGEGILRNTDELALVLGQGKGGLPGQSYKEQSDYVLKGLDDGKTEVQKFLKHCGYDGTADELRTEIIENRKKCDNGEETACEETKRLTLIAAQAMSLATAGGGATDDTLKITTKFSQKATETRSYNEKVTEEAMRKGKPYPEGHGADILAVAKLMKKENLSFEEAKKKHMMEKYNIQSEEEYNMFTNQPDHMGAMTGDGDVKKSTWKKYTGSMNEAHATMVGDMQKEDETFCEKNPDKCKEGENGPHAESYVRTFMDQMHWEQYIMDQAPRKSQNIDGKEVTPDDYYKCLDGLASEHGFKSEHPKDSEGYRKDLTSWLGRNAKPHPDEDSIAIGPDSEGDGVPDVVLGRDEMRTAGTAKKVHGYNGDALSKCLEKRTADRGKKKKMTRFGLR